MFNEAQFSDVKKLLGLSQGSSLGKKKEVFKNSVQVKNHFLEFVLAGKKQLKGAPRRKDFDDIIGKL